METGRTFGFTDNLSPRHPVTLSPHHPFTIPSHAYYQYSIIDPNDTVHKAGDIFYTSEAAETEGRIAVAQLGDRLFPD